MNTYTLLSGETIRYPDPAPEVAAFLARVRQAAADPAVSVAGITELIYGPDNPLLDTATLPGRALVTAAAFAHPVYPVLADQISHKQIQTGAMDLARTDATYTLSVPDAAARLGITPASVRAAIGAKKLSAILRNGQWWVHPLSVESYKVGSRGPKKVGRKAPPAAEPARVRARVGSATGASLSVRLAGGEAASARDTEGKVLLTFPQTWARAAVRTTGEGGSTRVWEIEPATGDAGSIEHGGFWVRGGFRIATTHNNAKEARAAWKSLSHATGGAAPSTVAAGAGEGEP